MLLLFAADLRRLREKAGSPTYRELARRAHYSAATLSQAAGGQKLPTLPVTLAYVRACGADPVEWEERWHEAMAEAAEPVPAGSDESPAPYVGLTALQAGDADRFFGRDQLLEELITRLTEHRVVALFGASGAGKSSLLRAGLLATVRAADDERPALLFTPGARPLEECAINLARWCGRTPSQLRAELVSDRRGLHRLVRQALSQRAPHTEMLIVVDQFEDVFTLCDDPDERVRFIDLLLAAAHAENSRCRLVLGVRADFHTHCVTHPDLAEVVRAAQVVVRPMTTDELRQAITQPAGRAGCIVESALVSRLIGDATGQPGVLPLVSRALLETWRRRRGNTLTLAGYEAVGGIERAVARTAEDVYTSLGTTQRQLAKQAFVRLTAIGEGTADTRRRVHRTELDTGSPHTAVVLERLTRARLLTVDQDSVEISHEALLQSWPRLRGWLAQDRDGLRVHRQLTEAAEAWTTMRRDPGALYRGTRLAIATGWAGRHRALLTMREREFLDSSVAAQASEESAAVEHGRRLRHLVALLSVLLVVASGATVVAAHARGTATEQRNIALSQKVAAEAVALRATNPQLAAQLSVAAYDLVPTVEARSSLLEAFATPIPAKLDGEFNALAFAPNGKVLATGGDDRVVRLRDLAEPDRPRTVAEMPAQPEDVESLAFSADSRTLVSGNYDGSVHLWDVSDPRRPTVLVRFPAHSAPVFEAVLSPDGNLLVTASADKTARLWDLSNRRAPVRLAALTGQAGTVWSAAFSPDGRTVATASEDGAVRLWDVTDRRRPHPLAQLTDPAGGSMKSVAFSPDGRILAAAGSNHDTTLWAITDPHRPTALGTLTGHVGPLQAVAFSPDGRTVATGGWDHTVRVWDIADPRQPATSATLTGHTNAIRSLAFSSDGRTLASASADHSALLTRLPGSILSGHRAALSAVGFSPNGQLSVVGSDDDTARVWDVGEPHRPKQLATLAGRSGEIKAVAFSPDGHTVAIGSSDSSIGLWDMSDPRHPRALPALTGHTGGVRSLAFRPRSDILASSSSSDPVVRLWDLRDPRHPRAAGALPDQGSGMMSIAWSPDGRTLATGLVNDVVLWDMKDPRRPTRVGRASGHTDTIMSVAFDASGDLLASASLDRTARLWDVADPRGPAPLGTAGHASAVQSVAFAPDRPLLATAGLDRSVRLWDITEPREPAPAATLTAHLDRVYAVAFRPDGRVLGTASEDGTARLYGTDAGQVAERICQVVHPRITHAEWRRYFPALAYRPPCG